MAAKVKCPLHGSRFRQPILSRLFVGLAGGKGAASAKQIQPSVRQSLGGDFPSLMSAQCRKESERRRDESPALLPAVCTERFLLLKCIVLFLFSTGALYAQSIPTNGNESTANRELRFGDAENNV